MRTRFSILPDERGLLLGVDKVGIFKPGIVYEVMELMGEYVIRPIGPFALPEQGGTANVNSDVSSIVHSGLHLVTKHEIERFPDEPK